jgi:hypothetical protein
MYLVHPQSSRRLYVNLRFRSPPRQHRRLWILICIARSLSRIFRSCLMEGCTRKVHIWGLNSVEIDEFAAYPVSRAILHSNGAENPWRKIFGKENLGGGNFGEETRHRQEIGFGGDTRRPSITWRNPRIMYK